MEALSPQALGWLTGRVPVVAGPMPAVAEGPPREPQLKRLLRFAIRWRWLLLSALAAGFVLGLVATVLMTRQYASTARLEISRNTARVTNIEGLERETSIGDQEFYQTQYGLLQATGLAERVAEELQLVDDPGFFALFERDGDYERAGALPAGPARDSKRRE